MAANPGFDQNGQFPLNMVGPRGEGAFLGLERMFFQGQTGLISTMYGIPNTTATRTSTGTYAIQHPSCREVDIIPNVQAPSGMFFQANIVTNNAKTGTAVMQFFQEALNSSVSSGFGTLIDPPTGTQVKLQFYVNPYGAF